MALSEQFTPKLPMNAWFNETDVQLKFNKLSQEHPDLGYHDIRRFYHEELYKHSSFYQETISQQVRPAESRSPPPSPQITSAALHEVLITNLQAHFLTKKQIILTFRNDLINLKYAFQGFKKFLDSKAVKVAVDDPVSLEKQLQAKYGSHVKIIGNFPEYDCVIRSVDHDITEDDIINEAHYNGINLSNAVRVVSRATGKPTTLFRIYSTTQDAILKIIEEGFEIFNSFHRAEASHTRKQKAPRKALMDFTTQVSQPAAVSSPQPLTQQDSPAPKPSIPSPQSSKTDPSPETSIRSIIKLLHSLLPDQDELIETINSLITAAFTKTTKGNKKKSSKKNKNHKAAGN